MKLTIYFLFSTYYPQLHNLKNDKEIILPSCGSTAIRWAKALLFSYLSMNLPHQLYSYVRTNNLIRSKEI